MKLSQRFRIGLIILAGICTPFWIIMGDWVSTFLLSAILVVNLAFYCLEEIKDSIENRNQQD